MFGDHFVSQRYSEINNSVHNKENHYGEHNNIDLFYPIFFNGNYSKNIKSYNTLYAFALNTIVNVWKDAVLHF